MLAITAGAADKRITVHQQVLRTEFRKVPQL